MGFYKVDENGKQIRNKVVVDCSKDEILVEQAHKKEVDINAIVKRHGVDLIAKTQKLQSADYVMDDISGNDFQEAMMKVTKAQQTFEQLPSTVRKQFNNSPAEFMDFVQNPDNGEALVSMGLATKKEPTVPIQVEVTNPTTTNPETPPE